MDAKFHVDKDRERTSYFTTSLIFGCVTNTQPSNVQEMTSSQSGGVACNTDEDVRSGRPSRKRKIRACGGENQRGGEKAGRVEERIDQVEKRIDRVERRMSSHHIFIE